MRAVWAEAGESFRVRDIVDAMNRGKRKKLAYTTIQSMCTILRDKGYLKLVSQSGRAHLLQAAVSQEEASRRMLTDLSDRLIGSDVQPLLQLLIDERLDKDELRALRDWVDRRLRDEGEES